MKLSFKKDPIFITLTVIVIIIWGVIMSKVISYFNNDEEPAIEIVVDVVHSRSLTKTNTIETKIEYAKLMRDPFILTQDNRKLKKASQRIDSAQPNEPLDFKINGVILNNKSKTLLILDQTNNQTIFLKEGMQYKSLEVVSISPKIIKIKEYNKLKTINVNN